MPGNNPPPSAGSSTLTPSQLAQGDTRYVKPLLPNGTDDTTAIQALIDAGGGVLGPGTFLATTLTLKSNVEIVGQGRGRTTIKLKNSANVDLIKGENFASLTGGGTDGGIHDFSLRNLTVDGNKANNTSGSCFKIYGYRFLIQGVTFIGAAVDNMYVEWGLGSLAAPDIDVGMEGQLTDVRCFIAGQRNIYWNGPHDSMWENVVCGRASLAAASTHKNVETGPNAGGLQISNSHFWGSVATYALYIYGAVYVSNTQMEGGTTAQWMVGGGPTIGKGVILYGTSGQTTAGLQIGDGSHAGVNRLRIDGQIRDCTAGAVQFNQDAGGSHLSFQVKQDSGNVYTGTPHANTTYDFTLNGNATMPLPGRQISATAGIPDGITNRDGTADVTLTTASTRVQRFTGLTANRTVNLPTGYAGARFEVRLGAHANFTLDVGGLKKFPPNVRGTIEVLHDGTAWNAQRLALDLYDPLHAWQKPAAALAETFPRTDVSSAGLTAPTSGRLAVFGITLTKGMVINTITFVSGSTPLSAGSNQWFALYDSSLALLGVTADDTSTAWLASTPKTLTLASPVTVAADGLFYVGIVVVATTVPNLSGIFPVTGITGIVPILSANSSTGLTNPASAPSTAAALSAQGPRAYVYVS